MSNLLDKYKTTATAEEGVKFEIMDLSGTPTGDFMVVKGSDSDTFIKARAQFHRECALIEEKDEVKKDREVRKKLCDFASKLVVSINGEPVEQSEIAAELFEAPAVREQIEEAAMRREKFLKKK